MGANESFLKAFRNFEQAVGAKGYSSVLEYEEYLSKLEEESGKGTTCLSKIRLCRQCRNFLSHDDAAFFTASAQMAAFLSEEARKMDSAYNPVRKYMEKEFIFDTTKLQAAMKIASKHKRNIVMMPVFDNKYNLIGYVAPEDLYSYISNNSVGARTTVGQAMGTVKSRIALFGSLPQDAALGDVSDGKTYVIDNGKGVPVGWY